MLKMPVKRNQPLSNYWLNWDETVVEETLCILRTKRIINRNYKILAINDTNNLPREDQLLDTPLVSSTDDTLFLILIVQPLLFIPE